MGLDSKARSSSRILGTGLCAAACPPVESRSVQIAPPTKAKPSRSSADITTQPGINPTIGRARKPSAGTGRGTMLWERLCGKRWELDVVGGRATMGGTVGERVALGRDVPAPERETPVFERDGLTDLVIARFAWLLAVRRPSPPASAGNRLRMVCARWVAWNREA